MPDECPFIGDLRTHQVKPHRFDGDSATTLLSQRSHSDMRAEFVVPPNYVA